MPRLWSHKESGVREGRVYDPGTASTWEHLTIEKWCLLKTGEERLSARCWPFSFSSPQPCPRRGPRLLGRMTTGLLLWVHLALCFSTPVQTWFKFTCRNLTVPIRMGWEAEDPLVCLWGFSVTLDTAQPALPSETEDQRLSWPCSHRLKRPPLAPHPSPRVWVCFSP